MNNVITKCVDCNKPFTITSNHAKWFLDRGLELPKRCKECREKRRNRKGEASDGGDSKAI